MRTHTSFTTGHPFQTFEEETRGTKNKLIPIRIMRIWRVNFEEVDYRGNWAGEGGYR